MAASANLGTAADTARQAGASGLADFLAAFKRPAVATPAMGATAVGAGTAGASAGAGAGLAAGATVAPAPAVIAAAAAAAAMKIGVEMATVFRQTITQAGGRLGAASMNNDAGLGVAAIAHSLSTLNFWWLLAGLAGPGAARRSRAGRLAAARDAGLAALPDRQRDPRRRHGRLHSLV